MNDFKITEKRGPVLRIHSCSVLSSYESDW